MINEWDNEISDVLFSAEDIKGMVDKVGKQISKDYAGRNPLFVVVLKCSLIFAADLVRSLSIHCEIDFMTVSSYVGKQSTGQINVIHDLRTDIAGRDIIIIEDILDSGKTLYKLRELLASRNPSSLKICTLLDKPTGRKAEVWADYVGGIVGDEFIVGYGFDYNQKFRNLPYIGVMRNS